MGLDLLTLAIAKKNAGSGTPGKDGTDGFSPVITENEDNEGDIYKLDIKTKTNTITTPNLIRHRGG